MANKRFPQLPAASVLYPDDIFAIEQLGVVTRHISASQLGIVPVATILALTSASSASAVAVSNSYADSAVAGIDLSPYATKSLASDMSGASLQASKSYTDAASGSLVTYINSLPTGDATLRADVMAVSAGLDSRIDALEDNPVPDIFRTEVADISAGLVAYSNEISGNLSVAISNKIDAWALSPYALVTSVQTTAGNLVNQINAKADTSALSSYALTTVAAAMSANAYSQSVSYTNAVSASLSTAISLISGGTGGSFLPLAGGTTSGNIAISAANPTISLMHPGGFTSSMQTSGGKLIIKRDSSSNHIIIDGTGGYLNGTWFLGSGGNNIQIAGITDAWAAEANAKAYTDSASGNITSYVASLSAASKTYVQSASANSLTHANAFSTTSVQSASANIMSYVGTISSVTPAYVQSASANSYVQSSAFTTTASGNIMAYVGSITANPPGDYVNLSTAQSISGTKTFTTEPYVNSKRINYGTYQQIEQDFVYLDLPNLISPSERFRNVGARSGSYEFQCSVSNFQLVTVTGPLTASFSGFPGTISPRALTMTIIVEQTGNNQITWQNVKWAGGTAPTPTPSGRDMFNFVTYNGGEFLIGALSLKDIK